MNDDYYAILGIRPTATAAEIKARFRFLSQAYHPDKFGIDAHRRSAEEEFKKVNDAYQVLSDLDQRKHYDEWRSDAATPPPTPKAENKPPAKSESSEHVRSNTARSHATINAKSYRVAYMCISVFASIAVAYMIINYDKYIAPPRNIEQQVDLPNNEINTAKYDIQTAEQGDSIAQYNLASRYSKGEGLPKDEAAAVKWYRKSAEQGFAKAQRNLGFLYLDGAGVLKDEIEAVMWLRKAAAQGDVMAQNHLGFYYMTSDVAEAAKWLRKAAEQGDGTAQYNLGHCYSKGGADFPTDKIESVNWYRKAAEQGIASAQFRMGFCYAQGDGIAKDEVEALKWFSKAADQGEASSQLYFAIHLATTAAAAKTSDDIVEASEDRVEALKWLYLSKAQEAQLEVKIRIVLAFTTTELAKLMTSEQIAEAKSRAEAWKPKKK